jgi:hypothetical protein
MFVDNISLNYFFMPVIKRNDYDVMYYSVQLYAKCGTSLSARYSEGSSALGLEAVVLD